ncbi:unnamed protein product [Amoebophrya sp. A25]|nr:unnamed protein product [Amoebophrya sp. A25]|eukprot:GSA25T00019435001.1
MPPMIPARPPAGFAPGNAANGMFGGNPGTDTAVMVFGAAFLVCFVAVLVYSCVGIRGNDSKLMESLKGLKAAAAAKDEELKKIEAHYLDRVAALQRELYEAQDTMQQQVQNMQKELFKTSQDLRNSMETTQNELQSSMQATQNEYRAYFGDFASQVSGEVGKQFSSAEIEPRLEKFRMETANDYERLGAESLERYKASQGALYSALNEELQRLDAQGQGHAQAWRQQQDGCQQAFTQYVEGETNRGQAQMQGIANQKIQECEQRVENAGSAKIAEFGTIFDSLKGDVMNQVQITAGSAIEDMQAGSRAAVENVRVNTQATVADMQSRATQLRQDIESEREDLRYHADQALRTMRSEAAEGQKRIDDALAACQNSGREATRAVADAEKKLTKRLDETDWWVRNNDEDAKQKVADMKEKMEGRIKKLEDANAAWNN